MRDSGNFLQGLGGGGWRKGGGGGFWVILLKKYSYIKKRVFKCNKI